MKSCRKCLRQLLFDKMTEGSKALKPGQACLPEVKGANDVQWTLAFGRPELSGEGARELRSSEAFRISRLGQKYLLIPAS